MARKSTKAPEPAPEPGFETRLARLREIVARLESGEAPLEEGVALYREGAALVAACRGQIEAARLEVGLAGAGEVEPFGPFGLTQAGNGDSPGNVES